MTSKKTFHKISKAWYIYPFLFSVLLTIFAWIIQERGQNLASTVALTQTHAITIAPVFCFLLGKKSAKHVGRKIWFVFYQSFIIAVTYLLMFLKRESTLLFTLSLFGWCLLWTAFAYIRIPTNWRLMKYQHYLFPLLPCAYIFFSLFIFQFAMWEDMASIFLPIIDTFLLILPILCFSYGKAIRNKTFWFILYQAFITHLPWVFLFWGYWVLLSSGIITFLWCILWGCIGRIKRPTKKDKQLNT